ncbi:MAG: DUF1848 domain-containing protein [Methylocystaceae bacterium]|nr:DUF1848 domain-containing protein [Methylocystaceae bacterium]
MIISASYKTDIPAFYTPWFINRMKAGFCKMVNPYNLQAYKISLKPEDVQAYVFWSRNYHHFLDQNVLDQLGRPFVCHMTVLNYPRHLDQSVIPADKAIGQMKEIARTFDKRAVVWRYDPIVMSDETDADWHLQNFRQLATELTGVVDEVIVSFVQFYRKTQRNFAAQGVLAQDPSVFEKQDLIKKLHGIAQGCGMELTICAQPELLCDPIQPSACIDVVRLESLSKAPLMVKRKSHRAECGCASSKDIGDYNTCPHGCLYCYAVEQRDLAKERYLHHDPEGEFLFITKEEVEEISSQPTLL